MLTIIIIRIIRIWIRFLILLRLFGNRVLNGFGLGLFGDWFVGLGRLGLKELGGLTGGVG